MKIRLLQTFPPHTHTHTHTHTPSLTLATSMSVSDVFDVLFCERRGRCENRIYVHIRHRRKGMMMKRWVMMNGQQVMSLRKIVPASAAFVAVSSQTDHLRVFGHPDG